MRGNVRSSSISRALGGGRAVTLSLVRWFCSPASPSSGKRGVVLQQRVSRESGGERGELSVNIGSQQGGRCPSTRTSLNTINISFWTQIAHKYSHSAPGPCPCPPSCCPRRRGRRRSWRSWTCSQGCGHGQKGSETFYAGVGLREYSLILMLGWAACSQYVVSECSLELSTCLLKSDIFINISDALGGGFKVRTGGQ